MYKDIYKFFVISLLVISLTFVSFITNFNYVLNNKETYSTIEDQETNDKILEYYQDKDNLDDTKLNQREKEHLADVKSIITAMQSFNFFLISLTIIILFALFSIYGKEINLGKVLITTGITSIALIGTFLVAILINFNATFTLMHNLLFKPGTWTFNNQTELLTRIYPIEFFSSFGKNLGINIIITSVVIIILGIIIKKFIYGPKAVK